MPYEDSPEGAADAPETKDGAASAPEEQAASTFEIPAETVPHADTLKPGDEIIFKFVGMGDKGTLQVQYATEGGEEAGGGGEGPSMMDNFDKEVS